MISLFIMFNRRRVRQLLRRAGGGTALEYAVLLGSVVVVLVLTLVSLGTHVGLSYESLTANVTGAPAAMRAMTGVSLTSRDGAREPRRSTAAKHHHSDSPPATASSR